MKTKIKLSAIILAFVCSMPVFAQTNTQKLTPDQAKEEQAYATTIQACLWGEPFRMYALYAPVAVKNNAMGVNFYVKHTELKTAKDRFVVTPNNVTIDAYAYTDLTKEPVVIFVPASTEKRWYIVQIGDSYDEVIYNVAGTKGAQPGIYIVTGPDYQGPVPGDMMQIKSRTNIGMSAVRIFTTGGDDLAKAVDFQKGFMLMPLSQYLNKGIAPGQPPVTSAFANFKSAAPAELQALDLIGFWMTQALPASADQNDPLVASFHAIGLSAANGFLWQTIDEATRRGIVRGIKAASDMIDYKWANIGTTVDGWKYTFAGGRSGHDLVLRAALARGVTGAELSTEVLYPNTTIDADGNKLDGANKYVLHLDKNQIPPVSVFWNLNMFGDDMFFVENDMKRYSIGSTTEGLKYNKDGSVDIYIQNENPGKDKESNWLPAPKGSFNLTMRLYGAEAPILNGTYHLPGVKKVK